MANKSTQKHGRKSPMAENRPWQKIAHHIIFSMAENHP